MPLISIITAAQVTRSQYHEATFDSVVTQSLPAGWEWEWVIQEDSEKPHLQQLATLDLRIKYQHNGVVQGAAGTRNFALGRARGQWFRNLDDDDILPAHALAVATEVVTAHLDVMYVTGQVLDMVGDDFRSHVSQMSVGRIPPWSLVERWLRDDYAPAIAPTALFARLDVVLALGGYMGLASSEDTGLLMALNATVPGWHLDSVVAHYRRHSGQITRGLGHLDPAIRQQRVAMITRRCEAIRQTGLRLDGTITQRINSETSDEY